jgi:hypothetical protein
MAYLRIWKPALLAVSVVLAACSSVDEAVFVTKTSLSVVDIDSTPPDINFAYGRDEIFFGPNYSNGSSPPAVGSIRSNGAIFSPEIKQVYATGDAAVLVVDPAGVYAPKNGEDELKGDKRPMIFGTSTNLGFKIGITKELPSVVLGYRRKEASYIPLQSQGEGKPETYASVLASIDTTFGQDEADPVFSNAQYFATGEAAKVLASQPYFKSIFRAEAQSALAQFDISREKFNELQAAISLCVFNLDREMWRSVLDNAIASRLFALDDGEPDQAEVDAVNNAYSVYRSSGTADDRVELMAEYVFALNAGLRPEDASYSVLLQAHERLVCGY